MTRIANSLSMSLSRFAVIAAACSPAFAGPQLEVRIDGQVTPSFSQQLFADTLIGEQQSLIVVLRNTGDEALQFDEVPPVQLSGGFSEQFVLIQPALESGNVLSPNGSTAFRVDFRPDLRFQGLNANIFVFTNDTAAAPYRMSLRGNGVAPTARIFAETAADEIGAEFDFGLVDVDAAIEQTFVIENEGNGLLKLPGLASLTGDAAMTITQQPAPTVAPGEATAFTVRFEPSAELDYSTLLTIPTNDPDLAAIEVTLLGRGRLPEEQNDDTGDGADEGEDAGEDAGDENADPNLPVDDEPVVDEPIDNFDPNFPEPNDGNVNPDDPNFGNADDNDPNLVQDTEERLDPNDPLNGNPFDDGFEPVVPGGLCGFGVGFASLASMISLGGMKRRR